MIDKNGTWYPEKDQIELANIGSIMCDLGVCSYEDLYELSIGDPGAVLAHRDEQVRNIMVAKVRQIR
jgi:hypothetical protein